MPEQGALRLVSNAEQTRLDGHAVETAQTEAADGQLICVTGVG